jgi:hypothetical protein
MVPVLSWLSSTAVAPIIAVATLLLVAAVAAGPARRRRALVAVGATVVLLAGCTGSGDTGSAAVANEASSTSASEVESGDTPELADAARTNPRHFPPMLDPDEPPAQMPPLDVDSTDGVRAGTVTFTTYTTPRMTPDQAYHPSFVIELDKESGELTKAQQMLTAATMFQPEPDGRYSYNIVDTEGTAGAGIEVSHYVTDDNLEVIATYNLDDLEGGDADLHDFELLDNGNAMLLAYRKREVDLSEFGGPSDGFVWDTVIAERTPDGETVWLWDGAEHMDLADVPDAVAEAQFVESPPSGAADYAHPNSLEIADDGDVLVSIRHYDCTLRIDRESGDIVWAFGGPNCAQNDFEISGDPFDGPSHQHDATLTDDGNLLIFDNGNLREGDEQISRVVEYAIDEEAMTAELVWSYDDDRYTPIMGSAERLDNGNTLIGWGELTAPAISEVTPDGEEVFSVSLPDGQLVYRAYQGATR